MPLPRSPFVAVSSSVLLLLPGCSSGTAFPTGRFTSTIEPGDRPPSPALVDDYRLDLGDDGGYVLEGAGFTARGRLVVDGDTVELRDDPCDRPLGGRQFLLTRHAWSP